MTKIDLAHLYQRRFESGEKEGRTRLWRILCEEFFQKYIRPTDCVLDLGAGYCEFINAIKCSRKIAVDLNKEIYSHADPGIELIHACSTNLDRIMDNSIDVVFCSNFFEHLPDKGAFLDTLKEVKRILVPGGKLLILQPNIRLLHGKYWDFLDHHLPLSDRTLVEALGLIGMQPIEVRPRFLPYTTKSRLPQHPWLIRLYLRLSLIQFLVGKQAWVVAQKPEET